MITQGRASAGPVDEAVELSVGDYISYRGDIPHLFAALTPDVSAVFVLEQA